MDEFVNPTSLLKISVPFLTLILGQPAWPVVMLVPDCPEKFVGKVESVTDQDGANSAMTKVEIKVEVQKYLSGPNGQKEKTFQILKYANLQFTPGNYYVISLNKKHLCMAEKIDSEDL